MTITKTITEYTGVVPDRSQPEAEFEANVPNFLDYMDGLSIDINEWTGQLNTTQTAVNTSEANAANSASTATTQAGIAADKASEASASADLAEEWASKTGATVDGSEYAAKEYAIGDTVESAKRHASGIVPTGSAKDWATSTVDVSGGLKGAKGYAEDSAASATTATTQAGIATTKAGEASTSAANADNSASAASISATTATTQAGIATNKANEAAASASAASDSASIASDGVDVAISQADRAEQEADRSELFAEESKTAATNALNTVSSLTPKLGLNIGNWKIEDGELVVAHLSTAVPSVEEGDFILTYEEIEDFA